LVNHREYARYPFIRHGIRHDFEDTDIPLGAILKNP